MISLLLAAVLANGGPVATASAAAGGPAVVATALPAGPNDVVIENSGSTNTAGYRIVVHPDATVDVVQSGITSRAAVARADASNLLAAVRAAAPLGQMTSARCMHSASFGSITRVTYAGQTSSDLGCGAGPAGRQIASAVDAIVGQLDVRHFRGVRRPLGGPGLVPHSAGSPAP